MTPEERKANIASQERHAANMGEREVGVWLVQEQVAQMRTEIARSRVILGMAEDCEAVRTLDALDARIESVRAELIRRRDEARDLAQRLRAETDE